MLCSLLLALSLALAPSRAPLCDGPVVQPWPGAVRYCQQRACASRPVQPLPRLTHSRRVQLERVNAFFNERYPTRRDGPVDDWRPIDELGAGDCEDYALAKQRALLELGWPASSLRVAVLFIPARLLPDGRPTGHAVLTVDTTSGTFVLDNLTTSVKPWTTITGYDWQARQSAEDPAYWVKIEVPSASR